MKCKNSRFKKPVVVALVLSVLSGSVLLSTPKPAYAYCSPCVFCTSWDLTATLNILKLLEKIFESVVKGDIEYLLNMEEERWVVEGSFGDFWVKAISEMTEYLSAVGMYQVQVVGAMFDAESA